MRGAAATIRDMAGTNGSEDGRRRSTSRTRFYRVDPAWRRLPVEEREAAKEAFAEVVEEWTERMQVLPYSLVGVRPEADFMLWKLTERYEDFRDLQTELNATPLAGWLETPHSYLAATRSSKYFERDPRRPPRRDRPARRALPRRLPVREDAAVVRAARWRTAGAPCTSTPRSAAASVRSRTTRRTRSGSTTRSS